jgi:chromatin remodeling complex protein RSC6
MSSEMSQVKQKSKKTKSSVEPVVSVPVVSAPVVLAPVVSEPVIMESTETLEQTVIETSEESNTEILFNKLVNQFQDIQSVMKTLHSNLKVLQKEVLRERKESKKKESKIKKKSDKKRSPSGFAKPAPISNDLAHFLDLSNGVELARTEVTSKVIAYVKDHQLQNPENKKQILVDVKLKALLLPEEGDIVTYFNLQTYLKKHFLQSTTTTTTTQVQVV